MRKIRDGILYDTETATCLTEVHMDFETQTLYLKSNGQYFLVLDQEVSGCPQADIKPLSLQEAKKWSEDFMSVEDYIRTFGPVYE